ncbi:unnamed protein product [Adineta steineri]|uniref:MULE transposase domain-containing protein n=1 Tax=Adineta steineri TaxID=433720 RepID=A0A819Y6H8_9BILA|nr:unnamed protein product [Adineta steineri]CAF4145416.1 unnamed protein product [Adineta steineri]
MGPPKYHGSGPFRAGLFNLDTKRLLILQKVKERVLAEPTLVTRIIQDEYVKNQVTYEERSQFRLPHTQASRLYTIRAKLLSPNPKSLNLEVPVSYSTHKKLDGRLMIFSTRYLIQMVSVIMGQHLGEAVPLVWCLTSKRIQYVYEKIFKILKTINALQKIFPNILIHGCWYHYTLCIYRNIQKIGLSTLYEQNEEIKV